MHVTDAGTQLLYYEHAHGTPAASLDQLRLQITAPGDEAVTPQATKLTLEYDAKGGDLGTAVGTFQAATPGNYTMTDASAPAPGTTLAIGPNVAHPLRAPLLGASAVLGVCVVATTLLAVNGRRRTLTSTSPAGDRPRPR